jgi:hypothetical protein
MASLIAIAALMLTAVPANGPPVLDPIVAFDDPAHCVPSSGFRQILDGWAVPQSGNRWELGTFTLPRGYEDILAYSRRPHGELVPMIQEIWGNNGRHDVSAAIQGSWHGLSVDYISVWSGPPSEGTMVELGFHAKADRVAPVLSQLGFPPAESWVHQGDGGAEETYAKLSCRFR